MLIPSNPALCHMSAGGLGEGASMLKSPSPIREEDRIKWKEMDIEDKGPVDWLIANDLAQLFFSLGSSSSTFATALCFAPTVVPPILPSSSPACTFHMHRSQIRRNIGILLERLQSTKHTITVFSITLFNDKYSDPLPSTNGSFTFTINLQVGLALIDCFPFRVTFFFDSLSFRVVSLMLIPGKELNEIGGMTVAFVLKHFSAFSIPKRFGLVI